MVAVLANVEAQTALKDAFKNDFLVGTALQEPEFEGTDTNAVTIIKAQFNAISAENALKWEFVHTNRGEFNFKEADEYVAFGLTNHMFVVGSILIWHHQTPPWVFQDDQGNPISRNALLERMHEHIQTVVGRYKGKIGGWVVVAEALNEDGSLHRSQWERIIGPDYLVKAYQFAHEADPDAQLYYDDYSLENYSKRAAAVALIKNLQSNRIPIAAVGLEGHYKLDWPPTNQVDHTIKAFASLGVKVMISELDIDMQPRVMISQLAEVATNTTLQAQLTLFTNGFTASAQEQLAKRYADLFKVFVANRDSISRVTIWGVTDGQSWLNDWPIKGRISYPLLFDRNYQPKPAFDAIIQVAHAQK